MKIRLLFLCFGWLAAPLAVAETFPRPPELNTAYNFWLSIYTDYSEHETVIHDRQHLDVIYKILDFRQAAKVLERDELRMHMRKVEKEEKAKLQAALESLAKAPTASNLSPEARRVKALWRGKKGNPYSEAAENLRGQRGLREKFERAIMRSGRYLPWMEKVFADMGLPVLLSRLPLVESSFNTAAYSKSGAAGVWQFMPSTAKDYMSYDEVADERRDPWLSTEAAAKHLRDDYDLLQDWPLAVTAYNFGRYGLARGLDEIGGSTLVDMIERYEGPRWGFAGKNFYAEFLAAVEVEQNSMKYFGPIRRDALESFEEVKTKHYVQYDTLRRLADQDLQEFARLNPSFSNAVVDGHLHVPPGKRIRLPRHAAPKFRSRYAGLGRHELHSEQKFYYRTHRVRRGDTLGGIARRYGTTMREIQRANGLKKRNFIRIGQKLKIPPNGKRKGPLPNWHTVQPGETLAGIARRYGLSLGALQKSNQIKRPEMLQVGKKLKIEGVFQPKSTLHTIRSGQTVDSIARFYGVSSQSISKANGLKNANQIYIGQKLKIIGASKPRTAMHTIRSGQTVESIARKYGVSVKSIANANGLKNVHHIQVGQRLKVPSH